MLLLSRTSEALSDEEHALSCRTSIPPRTTSRPTDQQSGELKGPMLEAFAAPYIGDEEMDIPFSPVPRDAPASPHAPTIPPSPTKGDFTMHFKHFHQGTCLLHLFTPDLALLALVLRHATSNEHLQTLTPLMSTTLDSLASAFETGTLLGLQQTGHVRVEGETMLTAEQVQAWCQKVVVEGVDGRVVPNYSADATTDSNAQATHVQE